MAEGAAPLNHLTNVTDWAGRKSSVAYDLDGRIKTITRPNGTYLTISYDCAGEETNILEQNVEGFPIALFSLNWNSAAEAQWEFAAPLPHTNTLPTRSMTYDADNRLFSVDTHNVTEDSTGNLLNGPLTNDTFANYSYDARNRLQSAGGVTNFYDALNNRIGQTYGTNSTLFVVNPNSKLPQVLMRTKNGVTTYYVYGPGLLYQVTETALGTNTLTYHYDYRGSTIALTADNGNVTDRMEYSLYATWTYHAGTNDTPFLFNGRHGVMTDPNGLLYMRARYYNPFLCRFINADPSGFGGGLNCYAYANGNPVSLSDPTGLGTTQDNLSFNWVAPTLSAPANPADPFSLGQGTATENAGNSPGSSTFENASPSFISENPFSGALATQYPFDNASPTARFTIGDAVMLGTAVIGQGELLPEEASVFGAGEGMAAETTGAENALNGVRLNQQLSAQSAFNASGGLSQEAIAGADEIIPASSLGNPAIPSGFSKFTTQSFDSPSGPFQVHFYQNPTTGEIWTGLDYKTVFNNPIGH